MKKIFLFMLKRTLKCLYYINTSSMFLFFSPTWCPTEIVSNRSNTYSCRSFSDDRRLFAAMDNPVTYLLSISQCILSLHVSNVSSMVLNWSSCLYIHKIVPVEASSHKFYNCLPTTSFLKIVVLKIVTSGSKKNFFLRGKCFQISVNCFRSPTLFVFTF